MLPITGKLLRIGGGGRGHDISLVTSGLFWVCSQPWYKCKRLLICLFAALDCFN